MDTQERVTRFGVYNARSMSHHGPVRWSSVALAGLVSLLLASRGFPEASLVPLGTLPNGSSECEAYGISPDGTTVVGSCEVVPPGSSVTSEAFRWTESGGMVGLGHLLGSIQSRALDVALDGVTVVGYSGLALCGRCDDQGVVWYGSELTPLGAEEGDTRATGVSSDGAVVAGRFINFGFRWTSAGGVDLSYLADEAVGVSADGETFALLNLDEWSRPMAYRWTASGGAVALSPDYLVPKGISPDGSTIVGVTNLLEQDPFDPQAFRWNQSEGVSILGKLPLLQYYYSTANATCAGGEIIVGRAYPPAPLVSQPSHAFVWNARNGLRRLEQILELQGVELGGWRLTDARAISDDCRLIAGVGTNPSGEIEGWVATVDFPLPAIAPLPATSSRLPLVAALLLIAGVLAVLRTRRRRVVPGRS